MIGHDALRSLDVWLADGRPVDLVNVTHKIDRAQAEKTAERYDLDPKKMFSGNTTEDVFKSLFEQAKKMFLKDGYHITIVLLFKHAKPVGMRELRIEEHGQKYLMMRALANEVIKLGADAAIMIGEIWMAAYDPKHKYRRSQEAPDRKEALAATLVRREGDPIEIFSEIGRGDAGLSLGENHEHRGGAPFMFAPLYVAWGREIPGEWVGAFKAADKRR
jgi:hypothetical protein